LFSVRSLCLREEESTEREERKEKNKGKKKKTQKIFQTWKFPEKIKDNL
jgi:hypothetical protein